MNEPKIGIIGSGLGGLAAACTLAARGHQVIVFEKNPWLGGKAAVLERAGFRFDMGPTILTLPSVLRRIFAEADRPLEDYLELVRLDPQWRSFFNDGSVLDLWQDESHMRRELDAFAPAGGTADSYQRFLAWSARLDRISNKFFFYKSVGGLGDMFNLSNSFKAATLGDVLAMRMHRTVAGAIRSFVPDARVSQMLDHFTQYVGSSPFASPAVLCGIAHMQTGEGVWYPMGGTRAVPLALARLARELGVEFRLNTGIQRIVTQDGRVQGVVTDNGATVPLAAVVANSDVVRTHSELLHGEPAESAFFQRRNYEAACSGVVLYLGLNRRYEHLAHHNFVFSRDPHEEFDFIYNRGEPAPDPTCYLAAPAQTEPGVAPRGGDALYVLVHTPYLRPGHDWRQMLPTYRRTILDKLKTTGGMSDIENRIVCEDVLTPQDINDRYRVLHGAIYGLASHGRLLGAFKPANHSPDVPGLYLAGGSAHPGPGMPMVMMSGWIAADRLHQDGLVPPPRAQRTIKTSPQSAELVAA
ncbi:MAG TPA: phytoene desaturase family protein [Verrucomicrobiae bacterium]|nr:phytoene desaturase family protein [Verrucomicrobiae bacterium]